MTAARNPEEKHSVKALIAHSDPAKLEAAPHVHGGAGTIRFQDLLSCDVFQAPFQHMHRVELPPKTGIGEHLHLNMDEMYYVFNGTAQFSVNGVSAELPGPCSVLCPADSSHGIYNHSDETLQWLNVAVYAARGKAAAENCDDDLTARTMVSPPPFKWAPLDNRLLKPVANMHGGNGTVLARRLWSEDAFRTAWKFCDHVVLPPGTSIGNHGHEGVEEIYYIVSGRGLMTINDDTVDTGPGDAVPCVRHATHGLINNGSDDLVLLVNAANVNRTEPQAS